MSVATLIYVSVSSVFLGNFFDDCLREGMIFERWGKFVDGKWWAKGLGGCQQCTLVWIFLFMLTMYYVAPGVYFVLSGIGLSQWILKVLFKFKIY